MAVSRNSKEHVVNSFSVRIGALETGSLEGIVLAGPPSVEQPLGGC